MRYLGAAILISKTNPKLCLHNEINHIFSAAIIRSFGFRIKKMLFLNIEASNSYVFFDGVMALTRSLNSFLFKR